ncbi:regulator of chromosome condensation [Excalfactoria chinensis]|uniref:regulator of chromosome condensation n=1 Tax=Excalfactoria chinensis TaxID=46218 RepID=UPI003B3A431B
MSAKRAAKKSLALEPSPERKKLKVSHPSHRTQPGLVLVLGQGDVGQLGLGQEVMERKKPALVQLPELMVQVEAGGMHTVCLSETGRIYTFGCNDEGALGRDTSEEGSECSPGAVELQENVVQVSAGDSHTAALTDDGRVFIWGSFRDNNGVIGLLEPMKKSTIPALLQLNVPVVKIASGNDHLVMLTVDGELFTCGCGEQGQLGRVPALFSNRGGRKGLQRLLVPQRVPVRGKGKMRFQDAFCGAYFTFAITREGHIYGFGLSNYHQLGTQDTEPCFSPQNLTSFKNSTKSWIGFSGGQHHTICVDSEGKAYSLGRAEYGRLGLGEGAEEKSTPTVIPDLPSISSVACGASVGYAVSSDGRAFAWGMGTNHQLGTGEEEDVWSPVEMTGKQLENRLVLAVSSGGQHTALLVKDKARS